MPQIKVSDYIANFIAALGVKHVFVLSGGGNLHLIDSIAAHPDLDYVCTHHEQSAAMAAEAYARVTENIGVCIVTFGPAATNTLTGVAGAWLDSIPVLYISGQARSEHTIGDSGLRQLGVQEINIIDMVKPITKYAHFVDDPLSIRCVLEKAIRLATTGRPGPVFLDIPLDVLGSYVEEEEMPSYQYQYQRPRQSQDNGALSHAVMELMKLLHQADRPLIFAGHGVQLAKARGAFQSLVEHLDVPIVTTMHGHDLLPTSHPLLIGRPGVFGDRAGNFAIQNADLLISIGARHHLWNIGYDTASFARNAKKVVVDIDPEELAKKTVVPDLAIESDARAFIEELDHQVRAVQLPNVSLWLDRCQTWKTRYPVVLNSYRDEKDYVNSYYFTSVLSNLLRDDEIIFTGVGTAFTGTLQSIVLKANQRLHCNVGCAAMGYDLPAAIGACFAANRKRIVLITGDGGMMLNLQELQTIRHHRLPIKIFLLNNRGYLAIRNSQNAFFAGRHAAIDKETGVSFPDFGSVAFAFDIGYQRIDNHDDMARQIAGVLSTPWPVICDVNMNPSQSLLPKSGSEKQPDGTITTRPLEDMFPLLDRTEFNANMYPRHEY